MRDAQYDDIDCSPERFKKSASKAGEFGSTLIAVAMFRYYNNLSRGEDHLE